MHGFRDQLKAALNNHGHSGQPYNRPAPLTPYWTAHIAPGTDVAQEWRHETGDHGWGNNELQNYTASPENSFFRMNQLGRPTLVLRAVVNQHHATSARLTSRGTLGRDFGFLSARITAPSAKGVWPAFWMLPSEPFTWPNDGEVDIMESWNDTRTNHSCLHWGHYNGQDHDKHKVIQTAVPDLAQPAGQKYGFAWNQQTGKLMWYIADRPVMQASIPQGTRRMADFQIKLNIALGGTVNSGQRPSNGVYEMEVHEVGLYEAPPGGWAEFESQLRRTPQGHPV